MRRAIVGTVLVAWICPMAHAQSAADANSPAQARLEFEVASIKPSVLPAGRGMIRLGPRGGPGRGDPGRVTYTFSTIPDLMVEAYSVKRYQISGGPNWLDSERFDILAKVPDGASEEKVKIMLQNLLADRFKLTLHRESKEMPMYALVVAAKGPKLKDSTVTDTPPPSDSQPKEGGRGDVGAGSAAPSPPLPPGLGKGGLKIGPDGCPETPPMAAGRAGTVMMITPSGECMISNSYTMDGLATQLSNRFDRPVIDQTGLKGKYDFRLHYDPSSVPGGRGGPIMFKDGPGPRPTGGDPENRIAPDSDPPPSIFNALQEQLGLKLEATKGSVDLLVIDHVEKTPTEN